MNELISLYGGSILIMLALIQIILVCLIFAVGRLQHSIDRGPVFHVITPPNLSEEQQQEVREAVMRHAPNTYTAIGDPNKFNPK